MDKIDIMSKTLEELELIIISLNEKPFRAKQIYIWLHNKMVKSFNDMTDLSKNFREKLEDKFYILDSKIKKKLISEENNTSKYLISLNDKNIIETVLMRHSYGNSICISSQVGCKMGCTFCASTLEGFDRNLTSGEMLSQIYEVQKDIKDRISSIVLMGTGEPLDNYDNIINFIRIVNSKYSLNIGQRHITLSTCGIVPNIYKFADENLQVTLAISLHASNDNIRKKLMPIAKKYSIIEIIEACEYYISKTKRRVTFEYALIKDINDKKEHAIELVKKLKNVLCHINLIPINDVKERNYIRTKKEDIIKFASFLQNNGIETTIRRELGSDINSACGQLRRIYNKR